MLAIDTSSLIAFLEGDPGPDTAAVEWAMDQSLAAIPPVVLSELLSDPTLSEELQTLFRSLPFLEISEGYWERTGKLRAQILKKGMRARLADSLIAQSCLDHEVALITRDKDFRHFAEESPLELFS
jgi:predicted nucleic acid-binding protein